MTFSSRPRGNALFLTALCTGAGVLHFVRPKPFDSLIPEQLPGSARAWTYGSGVSELATAALIVFAPDDQLTYDGVQRGQVTHGRAEAGGPEDHVGGDEAAVLPRDAVSGDAVEHR